MLTPKRSLSATSSAMLIEEGRPDAEVQLGSNSARVRLDGNIARRLVKKYEFFWWDNDLRGFGLRVSPGGSKMWFVQFRRCGKQKRITLGQTKDVSAAKARSAAREHLAGAALDGLPDVAKSQRAGAGGMTFAK